MSIRDELASARAMLDEVTRERDAARDHVRALSERVRDLREQMEIMSQRHETSVQRWQSAEENLAELIRTIDASNDKLRASIARLSDRAGGEE